MRLFLDTNVLVDHALVRQTGQPFEAKFILSWALENEISMYISAGSLYAFTYILQRAGVKGEDLIKRLNLYLGFLKISTSDSDCFLDSLQSGFKDLEDSFQYHTALRAQCDYFLTNNMKDFKLPIAANMKAMTPSDFLTNILKKQKGVDYQ